VDQKEDGASGNKQGVEALAQMVDQLNTESANDHDWITFNMLFREAYPEFQPLLGDKCPELTASDVRLAALIKLNLSNKQIGTVLNISRDSVVRAKYRLRQKMAFGTNTEMESFLTAL